MNAATRTSKFTMNISPEERAVLKTLATREGLTASDWLRQAIRRAHNESDPAHGQGAGVMVRT